MLVPYSKTDQTLEKCAESGMHLDCVVVLRARHLHPPTQAVYRHVELEHLLRPYKYGSIMGASADVNISMSSLGSMHRCYASKQLGSNTSQ